MMTASDDLKSDGTRVLNSQERASWGQRLNKSVKTTPLIFAKAEDANAAFQVSVTNGQVPEGKTLIIQLEKRPDIDPRRAEEVAQHALIDVFGRTAAAQAECDYRNVKEVRSRMGNEMVGEDLDHLTIIFSPGPIAYTRKPAWVRDQMALALKTWFDRSGSW
jgi:hypothetical protein